MVAPSPPAGGALINPSPVLHARKPRAPPSRPPPPAAPGASPDADAPDAPDAFDALEIFEHLRDITDPEHPYSLEQLNVVSEEAISVDDLKSHVLVEFTPTVQHCSMATLIGLCVRVKLLRSLPSRFKVDIRVAPGSHASEAAVNKQLNDKERVAAALENPSLLAMVDQCLAASES